MKPFETRIDAMNWIDANVIPGTLVSVRFVDGFTTMNRRDNGREPNAFPALWLRPVPGDMIGFGEAK
jgi:hypothetical protein